MYIIFAIKIVYMPTLHELRGLTASDRSESDKRAINQVMGYKDTPNTAKVPTIKPTPVPESAPVSSSGAFLRNQIRYQNQLDNLYKESLQDNMDKYKTQQINLLLNL